MRGGWAGIGLLLIAFACTGCDREQASPPADRLIRLTEDDAKSLDPQKISDVASFRIATDQFEGLTRHNGNGEAEAGLATTWQQSASGLEWHFDLRPGLRFSDGSPLTAEVFVQGLHRLRAPGTAAPMRTLFDVIADMTAIRPTRLRVRLIRPEPALPALLAQPALAALPMHRIALLGDDWTAQRPLVTSGPYRVREWRLNDRLVLERNPQWHEGAATIPVVEWQPVIDKLTALRRFEAGKADTMTEFPAVRLKGLQRKHGNVVHLAPILATYYFAFNTRQPPFDDERVRRALNLATDRRWLTDKLLQAGHRPAWGLIPPGLEGSGARPLWADWPADRRRRAAQALLAQAGYDARHPLRFTIRFNSDRDHRRIVTALAAMWRPLGVQAEIFNTEASLHFAALRRGEFELARSGWIADIPSAANFLEVHRSGAGAINYSGYANPAYDKVLDRGQTEPDRMRRAALFRLADALLIAQAPILPLYHHTTRALVAPRVGGWQDNPLNVHPSRTLRLASSDAPTP